MRAARRQPGLSHICDSVAEPSSNRRRPSIINPALSSRGSSHNMSPQVILTFSFFLPPLALHRFRCCRLITQICRFFHEGRCEREAFDLLASPSQPVSEALDRKIIFRTTTAEMEGKKVFFSCFCQS